MANRNTVYAEIFVDELARAGLRHVVLAPGSRNTALVLAFAKNPDIEKHSLLDERSAAFYALGLALASDTPVAVVCTSGSAAANFFPAVVEAHQSCVPLLILTADRPPELRHSGANQTIDQLKMYGDYALWFVDAALPEADPPAVAIRNVRTLADRAYATANGIRKGVVHINLPFRKPLEPTPVEGDRLTAGAEAAANRRPLTLIARGELHPTDKQLDWLAAQIRNQRKGLIICGPKTASDYQEAFYALAQTAGYPLLAEPTSGLRFHDAPDAPVIAGYNLFPLEGALAAPEIILQFGEVPTSNALLNLLAKARPQQRILITANGEWRDDQHSLSALLWADPISTCAKLAEHLQTTSIATAEEMYWRQEFAFAEAAAWQIAEQEIHNGELFDGGTVYDVIDLLPHDSALYAGNSLPVRHLDQFGKPGGKLIHAFANRGASGIDGNLSTALGIGAAWRDRPLAALVGDVTFYHDMNGLLAIQRCGVPATIVLLNNNGGGIFHRLPIRDYDPEFTDYFVTPHGLEFSHAAKLYGLDYFRAESRADFRAAFAASIGSGRSTLIEVPTDAKRDLARRSAIMQKVGDHLRSSVPSSIADRI